MISGESIAHFGGSGPLEKVACGAFSDSSSLPQAKDATFARYRVPNKHAKQARQAAMA
jgi:hypothetical protein